MTDTPTWLKVLFWSMLPFSVASVVLSLALALLGSFGGAMFMFSLGAFYHWVWTKRPRY